MFDIVERAGRQSVDPDAVLSRVDDLLERGD
jgi:hypothetical protein